MIEPRWLKMARADLGLREAPGIANNPVIVSRLASIQKLIGFLYNADSVPWCGAMMAWWMNQCHITPPTIAARASQWSTWGVECKPMLGAVMYMERVGGGHVTMCVGESATLMFGLGANQGDAVSIAAFPKERIKTIRWPKAEPFCTLPLPTTIAGAGISAKES